MKKLTIELPRTGMLILANCYVHFGEVININLYTVNERPVSYGAIARHEGMTIDFAIDYIQEECQALIDAEQEIDADNYAEMQIDF